MDEQKNGGTPAEPESWADLEPLFSIEPDAPAASDAPGAPGQPTPAQGPSAEAEPAPPATEAAAVTPPDGPAADDAAPGNTGAETEPPDTQTQPQQGTYQPFRFRVDGEDVEVKDAIETADGWIAMSREAFDRMLMPKYIGSRSAWRAKEQQYQREIDSLRSQRSLVEEKANTIVQRFGEIVEKAKQDREAAYEMLDDFVENWDKAQLAVENQWYRAQLERGSQLPRPEPQARSGPAAPDAETETAMKDRLRGYVDQVFDNPQNREYSAAINRDELVDVLFNDRRLVKIAAEDMPTTDGGVVRKGEQYFDPEIFNTIVRREAERALELHRARTNANAGVTRARTHNQAALSRPKPAPAVRASGTPAPGKELKQPQTYEEWSAILADIKP